MKLSILIKLYSWKHESWYQLHLFRLAETMEKWANKYIYILGTLVVFPRLLDDQNLYLGADYTLFVIFLSNFTSNFYFSIRFVSFALYQKKKTAGNFEGWTRLQRIFHLRKLYAVYHSKKKIGIHTASVIRIVLPLLSTIWYWIFVVIYSCVFTLPILPRFCSFCSTIPPCSVGVGQHIMDLNH